jgi:hypothetical protein
MLMQAMNENRGCIKIYVWFDIGGNASTSNKGGLQITKPLTM